MELLDIHVAITKQKPFPNITLDILSRRAYVKIYYDNLKFVRDPIENFTVC